MVQQITKGIKISVEPLYKGTQYKDLQLYHIFSYIVTIENTSSNIVKLTNRYWKIYDSLNSFKIVRGAGVIGQTPILQPKDIYKYRSGCILNSNFGAMTGFYTMINTNTFNQFRVLIPKFYLTNSALLN